MILRNASKSLFIILLVQLLVIGNLWAIIYTTQSEDNYNGGELNPQIYNRNNEKIVNSKAKKRIRKINEKSRLTPLFRNSQNTTKSTTQSNPQTSKKTSSTKIEAKNTSNSKLSTAHDQFQRDRGALGFTNYFEAGYSGSAYRYSGEEYPSRKIDFIWATAYESTCFSIYCIYGTRITGYFDQNNKNKNELRLVQLGIRFPGDLWGDYFAPEYNARILLPATPDEINKDQLSFGYGGAFVLATTPQLLGTDFYKISVGINFRKDLYKIPVEKQREWASRQAIVFDLKWTDTIFSSLVFAYNYSSHFDQTEKEFKEYSQNLRWRPNSWLDLMISHSNIGEFNSFDSNSGGADLVSIGTSTIGFSVGVTSVF